MLKQKYLTKMKNLRILSLALLAVTFVLGSCNKYEEGPALSLRTKKARITNTWKTDKYVDSDGTEENAGDDDGTWEIKKDNSFTITQGQFTANGTWEFVNDKESLKTTITYSQSGLSFTEENTVKIIKLKNDELWIEDEDGDQTHLIPA